MLGILNSALIQWRFKLTSTNNNVGTNELHSLPFREIDFARAQDRLAHDGLVLLVRRMIELCARADGASKTQREILQRQIRATDRAINTAVYALYGVSTGDMVLVERQG
jgi:hypothetical protein